MACIKKEFIADGPENKLSMEDALKVLFYTGKKAPGKMQNINDKTCLIKIGSMFDSVFLYHIHHTTVSTCNCLS